MFSLRSPWFPLGSLCFFLGPLLLEDLPPYFWKTCPLLLEDLTPYVWKAPSWLFLNGFQGLTPYFWKMRPLLLKSLGLTFGRPDPSLLEGLALTFGRPDALLLEGLISFLMEILAPYFWKI